MNELEKELREFTGTEILIEYKGLLITMGIKYLAEVADAYFLLDSIVATHEKFEEWFCILEFKKLGNQGLVRVKSTSNYKIIYHTEFIKYTDFPLKFIEIYVMNNIITLPWE